MSDPRDYPTMRERLEPKLYVGPGDTDELIASIAVSLKRIADAMETQNAYGEHGSEALAGAIYRGLRGI